MIYQILLEYDNKRCIHDNKFFILNLVIYFQDITPDTLYNSNGGGYITLQPHDQVSIVISSKDAVLSSLVNLPRFTLVVGNDQKNTGNQLGQISAYTLDSEGNIEFPLIGKINLKGLTREQAANKVSSLLREDFIKDAITTVDFVNLNYTVMGEVVHPGKYPIFRDRMNILEALSSAGDLTINGKRDKIFLIRSVGDMQQTFQVDIRSTAIFASPAFYLQQGDVIYVEPNRTRANQSTVNGNSARSISLWLSITSVLTTLALLIF